MALLQLHTSTAQFISIAFSPSIAWDTPEWVRELLLFTRNLGLDGKFDMPGGMPQLGAVLFVALTYFVLVAQESVEWRMFVKDQGSWHTIYTCLDGFVSAVSNVLFMPVIGILLSPADAIKNPTLNTSVPNG